MTQLFTYLLMHPNSVPCPHQFVYFCIMTQQTATFWGAWTRGWGLWPPNSNLGKIFVQCT